MNETPNDERTRWMYHFAQLSKFGSIGSLNAVIDFTILNLLSSVSGIYKGPWLILFNALSFAIAVVNSYLLNKRWTFKHNRPGNPREFSTFFGIYLIGLGLNSILVYSITSFVTPIAGIHPQLWLNVAKVVSNSVSAFWNFFAMKFLVFK